MEIICKSCNTSHYLSDDKIPLETKIGKCKQCSSPITVLGKNTLGSIELSTDQSTSTEQEATKNCDFCGEKILAIAKKCRHCGSSLNNSASVFQNDLEQNTPPLHPIEQSTGTENWFYEKNGQRQSVTKAELITLIKSGKISHETFVWKQGFSDWMNIESTELRTYLNQAVLSPNLKKPIGIVLIAICSICFGFMNLMHENEPSAVMPNTEYTLSILIAVIYFLSAYGLWLFESWGWRFTFWFYVIDIPCNIFLIFPIFNSEMTADNTFSQLIIIVVAIAIIFYIRRNDIKDLYGISGY